MAATVVKRTEEQHDAAARDAKRPRHRDEMRSPDAKRFRHDDRVSSSYTADRKRDRERYSNVRGSSVGDRRRRYSSSSYTRRGHARRTPENRDAHRRRRSPASEPKTCQQVPCALAPQPQPMAAPYAAPAALDNSQSPLDLTEQFEETELRRREIQQKREEARREMDKVVQSVYFNEPFVSLMDVLMIKR